MPEDIIAYVCSDLSAHAPQAEAGLRDQACDRILGRYIQQEDLDRMRDDPEDLLACLQECITLDNEQLAKAKEGGARDRHTRGATTNATCGRTLGDNRPCRR